MELSDKIFLFPYTELRIVPLQSFNGLYNMCLDMFYAEQVATTGVPVLRFYSWHPYCLSLGHHQKLEDLDKKLVVNSGYEIVRRPTGGSAIFHSEELTYSFLVPIQRLSHHDVYELFHKFLAQALKNCGFSVKLSDDERKGSYLNQSSETFACFNRSARSEIQFQGKKVVGSAQKLLKGVVLQHGSIMLGTEHEKIVDFLKLNKRQKREQKQTLQNKSIALNQILPDEPSKLMLIDAIVEIFERYFNGRLYFKYSTRYEVQKALKFKNTVIS